MKMRIKLKDENEVQMEMKYENAKKFEDGN